MNPKISISDYLNLVRWKNLLMILLTQFIVYFLVIQPIIESQNKVGYSFLVFISIAIATVLTAAAGYLINNIQDVDTDRLNNKNNYSINLNDHRNYFLTIYYVLNTLTLFIAIYPLFVCKDLLGFIIFPVSMVLLYFYTKRYKSSLLTGNIIVSLLTALSIIQVVLFERNIVNELPIHLVKVILVYAIFAFLVSMIREIVKDIEDIEGDFQTGIITVATKLGVVLAKKIAIYIGGMVILLIVLFMNQFVLQVQHSLFLIICQLILIIIGGICIYQIFISKTKNDFHKSSNYLKIWMFIGILSMCLIPLYYN